MASVRVNHFVLGLLSGNRVRIDVDFSVQQTATESRLGIPTHVWIRLMERDGTRDVTHLHADWFSNRLHGNDDDPATGWMYAGLFNSSTSATFSRVISRNRSPGEIGNEEYYAIAASRPDLISDVEASDEIVANLA